MNISKAAAILRKAEQELQRCVGEAAAAGDYDTVDLLNSWAKQLAALSSGKVDGKALRSSEATHEPLTATAQGRARAQKGRKRLRRSRSASAYPKFARERNDLIKVGWSKRAREEYHHRAPYRVVTLLVDGLLAAGKDGKLFTTEELLPLKEANGNGEVPDYQAYLCLAWLRTASLVEGVGRQGYRITSPDRLKESAEKLWQELPSLSGLARTSTGAMRKPAASVSHR